MLVTAFTKFTALDFPGHLACIIFTGGCNLRCGFCHNAEFVIPEKLAQIKQTLPFETVMNFLKRRVGLLDGVVICGGEPTVQADLIERIKEIRELGFAVKLDSNGANPAVLERVLAEGLVDYVAMDLKDALPYRRELVGVDIPAAVIRRSIRAIRESGVKHEFRSTILPEFHDMGTLRAMGGEIEGAQKWSLQMFRSGKTLNEEFREKEEFRRMDLEEMATGLKGMVAEIEVR